MEAAPPAVSMPRLEAVSVPKSSVVLDWLTVPKSRTVNAVEISHTNLDTGPDSTACSANGAIDGLALGQRRGWGERQRRSVAAWNATDTETVSATIILFGTRLHRCPGAGTRAHNTRSLISPHGTRERLEAPMPYCTRAPSQGKVRVSWSLSWSYEILSLVPAMGNSSPVS